MSPTTHSAGDVSANAASRRSSTFFACGSEWRNTTSRRRGRRAWRPPRRGRPTEGSGDGRGDPTTVAPARSDAGDHPPDEPSERGERDGFPRLGRVGQEPVLVEHDRLHGDREQPRADEQRVRIPGAPVAREPDGRAGEAERDEERVVRGPAVRREVGMHADRRDAGHADDRAPRRERASPAGRAAHPWHECRAAAMRSAVTRARRGSFRRAIRSSCARRRGTRPAPRRRRTPRPPASSCPAGPRTPSRASVASR